MQALTKETSIISAILSTVKSSFCPFPPSLLLLSMVDRDASGDEDSGNNDDDDFQNAGKCTLRLLAMTSRGLFVGRDGIEEYDILIPLLLEKPLVEAAKKPRARNNKSDDFIIQLRTIFMCMPGSFSVHCDRH